MTKHNPSTPPPFFTTSLPIIQRLIVVYKIWHEYLPKFSKDHRYTLGFKIDALFVEVIETLHGAQYARPNQKYLYLDKSSLRLDTLKFFIQILWEIGGIEQKKYIHLSEHLSEIGKMLGGWRKNLSQNQTLY